MPNLNTCIKNTSIQNFTTCRQHDRRVCIIVSPGFWRENLPEWLRLYFPLALERNIIQFCREEAAVSSEVPPCMGADQLALSLFWLVWNQFLRCNRGAQIIVGEESGMKSKLLRRCIEKQPGGGIKCQSDWGCELTCLGKKETDICWRNVEKKTNPEHEIVLEEDWRKYSELENTESRTAFVSHCSLGQKPIFLCHFEEAGEELHGSSPEKTKALPY